MDINTYKYWLSKAYPRFQKTYLKQQFKPNEERLFYLKVVALKNTRIHLTYVKELL
jgi:hypothetical protein